MFPVIQLGIFGVELGGNQPAGTMLALRVLFAGVPAAGTITAFLVLRRYPLTRARMIEVTSGWPRPARLVDCARADCFEVLRFEFELLRVDV